MARNNAQRRRPRPGRILVAFALVTVVALGIVVALATATLPAAAQNRASMRVDLTIHADQPRWTIDRRIYGQFAEHLGHGVYGGLWVGEDSSIPNTRGLRNDVVAALKNLKVPVVRWPGAASPMSTTGAPASARASSGR